MVRLDKFLSDAGTGTRSEVKKLLRGGRVRVNGQTVKTPEMKVDPQADRIFLDGKQIVYEKYVWYMVHKNAGCVTAVRDSLHKTVMDLLPEDALRRTGLSPVGRLDLDTEGLLLVTDDGETGHRLLSPSRHVMKTYFAVISGDHEINSEEIETFAHGLDIGDEKLTASASLEALAWDPSYEELVPEKEAQAGTYAALVSVREGRYHQIKRMFQAVGREVLYLKRTQFGPLVLDPSLKKGCSRKLTADEVNELMAAAGLQETDRQEDA